MNPEEQAIAAVLAQYESALNASSADAVLPLYADDAVFMAQNFASKEGISAIGEAYRGIFGAITLRVKFSIAEIRQLSPDWAFARTKSAGTVTVHATGASSNEANQELFVFQKVHDKWKIARYCFSTTNPAR